MMCVEGGEGGGAKGAMSQPLPVANSQWWEKKRRKERNPGGDEREASIAGSGVEEGQAGLEERGGGNKNWDGKRQLGKGWLEGAERKRDIGQFLPRCLTASPHLLCHLKDL